MAGSVARGTDTAPRAESRQAPTPPIRRAGNPGCHPRWRGPAVARQRGQPQRGASGPPHQLCGPCATPWIARRNCQVKNRSHAASGMVDPAVADATALCERVVQEDEATLSAAEPCELPAPPRPRPGPHARNAPRPAPVMSGAGRRRHRRYSAARPHVGGAASSRSLDERDRGTPDSRTARSSPPCCRRRASVFPSGGPEPGPTLSPRTRPIPLAPTAPSCADAISRQSSRRRRSRPPTRKKKGSRGGRPPRHDADLYNGTRSNV